jgi:Transposase DDE domain group 1
LARNERLTAEIAAKIEAARVEAEASGKPARRFRDFTWSTLDSWSRTRRIIGKAEWSVGAPNLRFVVTSLKPALAEARHLYETICCARGEMENRIKECQLDLLADRTSATTMRANQNTPVVCLLRRASERRTCQTIGADRSTGSALAAGGANTHYRKRVVWRIRSDML